MTISPLRRGLTFATCAAFALVATGVVVQVFLAGLALFGGEGFATHESTGWIVHTVGMVAVPLAIAGPRTALAIGGAIALTVLNTIQILLSSSDTAAVAALHPTLALAVLALAAWLVLQVRPR